MDLALSVGELAETVTVSGETPLLQTDRTDTGRTLESIQVTAMPLSFNRNFQGMMATVPGASRPYKPHSEFFNSQDSLATEVNGQSRLANNVLIEGLDNNQRTGLLTVLIPPAEAIDAVSVTTSNYDAEFGRAAGAVTSVTLKSGTNTLKGSAFWFGNTEKTNALPAASYFSTTRTKPPTTYNQFGFTIGGPIKKNRLFFFGDYQRTQDRLGAVQRYVVPTEAFRRGDFSAAPTKVYDPATGDVSGNNRLQFANNQIPSNRISPIALALLAKIPLPNLPGVALGQVNYQVNSYRDKNTDSFDTKVNYALNDSNQISARFSYQRPEVTQLPADGYGDWGGPLGGGFMATGTNMTYSTAANWTRTLSNTFLMEVRGGTSYYHNEALTTANGQNLAEQVGIKGVNLDEWTSGPTTININNGYTNPALGYVGSLPWDRWERTWEISTTLTKVLNNHTIKFGGNYRRNSDKLLQTQDNQGPRGGFTFSGAQTGSTADTGANSGIANSMASFLLDLPSGMARDLKVLEDVGSQHWAVYSFVQDKWQVSPRMTVDLGVRWEYYDPIVGLSGKGSLSNFDPATNSLLVSGFGNIADDFGLQKDLNNFSPRVGATFRLDEKTVLRGGFGGSTMPFPDNSYAFNFPVKQNNSYQTPNSYAPTPYNMAAGFPAPSFVQIPDSGIIDANAVIGQSLFYVPNDLQQGTLYSWNVAFQREIAWGLTGEVAYVGNMNNDALNRFPMNAGLVVGAGNAGRPFYKYGKTAGITNLAWKSKTRYNGLQMKLDRRFRNGWLVTNSYTYLQVARLRQRQRRPEHAGGPRAQLGLRQLRPGARLRVVVRLVAAVVQDDRRRRPALGARRLAGVRHPVAAVGAAAGHHDDQRRAQHAGQHAAAGPDWRSQRGQPDERRQDVPPVVRHVRVRVSGSQHVRHADAQHGRHPGPRVHQPRYEPREAVRVRRQPVGRVPPGRVEPAEHGPHEQPEHDVSQLAVRQDHRRLQRAPDALQSPLPLLVAPAPGPGPLDPARAFLLETISEAAFGGPIAPHERVLKSSASPESAPWHHTRFPGGRSSRRRRPPPSGSAWPGRPACARKAPTTASSSPSSAPTAAARSTRRCSAACPASRSASSATPRRRPWRRA